MVVAKVCNNNNLSQIFYQIFSDYVKKSAFVAI